MNILITGIHGFVGSNLLLNDKDLYESCKAGGKKLSVDFDRKELACNMLDIIKSAVCFNNK